MKINFYVNFYVFGQLSNTVSVAGRHFFAKVVEQMLLSVKNCVYPSLRASSTVQVVVSCSDDSSSEFFLKLYRLPQNMIIMFTCPENTDINPLFYYD